MWKWIGGILLVVVVLIAGTCYQTYRSVVGGGDSATITVPGTPEHVFAALVNPDSIIAWERSGTLVTPVGRGALQVGDTLTITPPHRMADSTSPRETMVWVVREIQAPVLLVLDAVHAVGDSGAPFVSHTVRDSIVAAGDSTRVIATVSIGQESLPSRRAGDSGDRVRVLDKLAVGAFRMALEFRLGYLKTYLERKP